MKRGRFGAPFFFVPRYYGFFRTLAAGFEASVAPDGRQES
jgi:hypothetical protein